MVLVIDLFFGIRLLIFKGGIILLGFRFSGGFENSMRWNEVRDYGEMYMIRGRFRYISRIKFI